MTHEVTKPEIPFEHAGFLKGGIRPETNQNYAAARRLCELFIVIVAAPSVLVTIALLALTILWTVGPPVFVKQDRVGKGGRIFKQLKLRTRGFSEHIKPSSREDTRVTL